MNYNESKETVLQLLPTDDAILQLAEECVELSKEFLIFNNTERRMPTRVMPTGAIEEAATWSWWRKCCLTRYMPRMIGGFCTAWWDLC